MVSFAAFQLFARILFVLCAVSVASSSPRPHFGELNPDDSKGASDFLENYIFPMEETREELAPVYEEIPYAMEKFTLMKRLNLRRSSLKKKLRNKNQRSGVIPCFFNAVSCFGHY